MTPSKSDAAVSWRRGGNNSVLSGGHRTISISVTPPPSARLSPPLPVAASTTTTNPTNANHAHTHASKARPLPLRFITAPSQPLPTVAVIADAADTGYDAVVGVGHSTSLSSSSESSESEGSASPPTTPQSASSNEELLSLREEASKKLYAGLGIGRPVSVVPASASAVTMSTPVASHRMVIQPLRQPRGPPSGADELGPMNFATRIRRKAIGGLGTLMDARERRDIEAF
jgi:hypothetical protein